MKNNVYRQGDVMVKRVDSIPEGGTEVARDKGGVVLAYGEVTGHCHQLREPDARMLELANGQRFLDLKTMAFLKHEEHSTIELPPGTYEVIRQKVYTPQAIRNVAD